ncbi:MAG: succinyl-diaminopimelate desuccinylase [Pseudomonadota bacterium]
MSRIDPVALTADLVRCPSVTPAEAGALTLLHERLAAAGFGCTRVPRGGVDNLYARFGTGAPMLAFAGHTDVVPVGDPADWSADPFGAEVRDGRLIGRGSVDMKSGVAAFVAAAIAATARLDPARGSVALIVTGDEEGEAAHGTCALLDWMAAAGERPDFCIVGEPTSRQRLGDTVKIGRRGSMTGRLTVTGTQGHTAYPDRAENPLPALARIIARLAATPLDQGSAHFEPTTLALTSIDVGNPANNVIPRQGRAVFNIRFNDLHTSGSIKAWAAGIVAQELGSPTLETALTWQVSGESFLTQPSGPVEHVVAAVEAVAGVTPELGTGGGTSDARFIKHVCPVVELGLVGRGMHAVDEAVAVDEIEGLTAIYGAIIDRYFGL